MINKQPKYINRIPYFEQRCKYCWKKCGRSLAKHLRWKDKNKITNNSYEICIQNKYTGLYTDTDMLIVDGRSCYYQTYIQNYNLLHGYKNKMKRVLMLMDSFKYNNIKISNKVYKSYERLIVLTEKQEIKVDMLCRKLFDYACWYSRYIIDNECGRESLSNPHNLTYSVEWNRDNSLDKVETLCRIKQAYNI